MDGIRPCLPDYSGANLTGIIPALLEAPTGRPGWVPAPARDADQVVLLVLDGLGWNQLRDRRHLAPVLAAMDGGPITTVAPSTTACALTSLVTGAAPAVHGVVGYKVAVPAAGGGFEVMNVLRWRTPSGDVRDSVDPLTFSSRPPFLGRPVPVVSKAEFAGTPFTEAHQHGAPQVGWYAPSGMAVEVGRLVRAGEPLVYAYYDGVDRVAHMTGFGDHYDAEVAAADRLAGDLLAVLPPSVALVVTADHGQVDVGTRVIDVAPELLELTDLLSGEPRFRWLHARSGAQAELLAAAEQTYGSQAWVLSYDRLVEEGWLGGRPTAEVRSRLGDVAVVPWEPVAYLGTGEAAESRLLCRHGSLTEDEMLVPLIAGRGRLEG